MLLILKMNVMHAPSPCDRALCGQADTVKNVPEPHNRGRYPAHNLYQMCSNRPGHGASPSATPVTYNVTYLMLDAIYQVQTFAMLCSSGDLNECEVGFSVLPGRDMTPWPGFGRAGSIRSYPVR
jgi:hypothetical protein